MGGLIYNTTQWSDTLLTRYHRRSKPLKQIIDDGYEKQKTYPKFAEDVHARLYLGNEPDTRETPDGAEWAETLHQQASDLPDWQRLRHRCRRSPFSAGIATEQILRATLDSVPQAPPKQKGGQSGTAPPPPDPDKARRDMRQAAKQASAAVDGAEQAVEPFADALGINAGNDPTRPQSDAAAAALLALYEQIREHPDLAYIAELAGRMRHHARAQKRSMLRRSTGGINGIAPGERDILPQELAGLRDGRMLRLRTLRRVLNKQALAYRRTPQAETLTHGPFVVLLDVSASMGSERLTPAKALALALMCTAIKQRRTFAIVTFNAGIQYQALFPKGSRPDIQTLLALLDQRATGGTDFDIAIQKALDIVKTEPGFDRADILMVTDGESRIDAETVQAFQAIDGLTLYGLGIGDGADRLPDTLRGLASECWLVANVTGETGATLAPLINP